jgi:hypothetical protein
MSHVVRPNIYVSLLYIYCNVQEKRVIFELRSLILYFLAVVCYFYFGKRVFIFIQLLTIAARITNHKYTCSAEHKRQHQREIHTSTKWCVLSAACDMQHTRLKIMGFVCGKNGLSALCLQTQCRHFSNDCDFLNIKNNIRIQTKNICL